MPSMKRTGNKGGKKLRRSKPHITPAEKRKVQKGVLHKQNSPKSRPLVFSPNPTLVTFYRNMAAASNYDILKDYRERLVRGF